MSQTLSTLLLHTQKYVLVLHKKSEYLLVIGKVGELRCSSCQWLTLSVCL